MIISKKRFEAEVAKRVEEAVCKCHKNFYREQRTDETHRRMRCLEIRMIEVEKKCGIDHPSHHPYDNVTAGW